MILYWYSGNQNIEWVIVVQLQDTLYWLQVNQSLFFFFTWSFVLSRHFLFVFICIVIVDPIIKKAEGGDPILYTAWYMFVPVPSQELDFHRHMLWSFFSIIWKEMRLFCWYWWILFLSLFNFSFNKYQFYSAWFVPKRIKFMIYHT